MADYTAQQILEGSGGRVSTLQKEVIRLLRESLPGVVDLVNTRDNLDIASRVSQPGRLMNFYAVRESLEGAALPCVAVGSAVSADDVGNDEHADIVTLIVYAVNARTEVREQVDDMWDLAQLCQRILSKYRGSHCLPAPDGRLVWKYCRFRSMTALPMDWEAYSGLGVEFSVNMGTSNLWPLS